VPSSFECVPNGSKFRIWKVPWFYPHPMLSSWATVAARAHPPRPSVPASGSEVPCEACSFLNRPGFLECSVCLTAVTYPRVPSSSSSISSCSAAAPAVGTKAAAAATAAAAVSLCQRGPEGGRGQGPRGPAVRTSQLPAPNPRRSSATSQCGRDGAGTNNNVAVDLRAVTRDARAFLQSLSLPQPTSAAAAPKSSTPAHVFTLDAAGQPQLPSPHHLVVVLVGLPGCGKSFFASRLLQARSHVAPTDCATATAAEAVGASGRGGSADVGAHTHRMQWKACNQDAYKTMRRTLEVAREHLLGSHPLARSGDGQLVPAALAATGSVSHVRAACSFYRRGMCREGDRCRFSHRTQKTGPSAEAPITPGAEAVEFAAFEPPSALTDPPAERLKMPVPVPLDSRAVIIDRCNFDTSQRATWLQLAAEVASLTGQRISTVCVVLPHATDVNYCVRRAMRRGIDDLHSVAAADWRRIISRMASAYEPPSGHAGEGFDCVYWCDYSGSGAGRGEKEKEGGMDEILALLAACGEGEGVERE